MLIEWPRMNTMATPMNGPTVSARADAAPAAPAPVTCAVRSHPMAAPPWAPHEYPE
jgi:hypothetical protein